MASSEHIAALPTALHSEAVRESVGWSQAHRVVFRFVFAYVVLFLFPAPLGALAGTEELADPFDRPWRVLAVWVGRHVLHLPRDITNFDKDSSDTTYGYVQLLCVIALAAAATVIWSALDRQRTQYRRLHDWLRVYVRYVVASIMFGYAMIKVIKLQFPFPAPDRLMQSLGDSSPHELLWNFMGYSTSYTLFAGATELIGAVLLFFRRTTLLGALVLLATLTNVVALNFSYDVPVKLWSMHLLLLTIFLLAPDVRRLADVLVFNHAVAPAKLNDPKFAASWMNRAALGLKVLFVGYVAIATTMTDLTSYRQWGDGAPKQALDGLYMVETFLRNGEEVAIGPSDGPRWRWVSIEGRRVVIERMDDSVDRYRMENDASSGAIELVSRRAPDTQYALSYARPDDGRLVLNGTVDGGSLSVTMRRVDESKFLLVSRGFHWVSEFPLNR